MNFKEYIIFKEAKKNSTKGKKKPAAKEPTAKKKEEVSIDDLKVQLDDLVLKIQKTPNIYQFTLDKNEFIEKASEYAKKYLNNT